MNRMIVRDRILDIMFKTKQAYKNKKFNTLKDLGSAEDRVFGKK